MAAQERKGAVTFKNNPITLIGPEVKAGDKAPDFKILAQDLSETTLANFKGKTLVISVVPSLDTPVCEKQTIRFNDEASKLPDSVAVITVSMDLPFAQKRFCSANNTGKIKTYSDHRDASFGTAYGALIKELRLLTRAIFIVAPNGKVQYVEYVKEVTQFPDFDKALNALKVSAAV